MSATPRQVSTAVGLIIAGAMRDVDNGTSLSAVDIYHAVARELADRMEGEPELIADLVEQVFAQHIRPQD